MYFNVVYFLSISAKVLCNCMIERKKQFQQ